MLTRFLYHSLIALGKPIGGIRPRRLYDALGRRAYPTPEFHWTRDRWNAQLLLSHHFHLDRNILIYGDYDHDLHLLFEARIKPGMTALDVGSNLGEMALHLAHLVGPTGTVHAFEPMPAAFARLHNHIEKNQLAATLRSWNLALSNATGEMQMTIPSPTADNQGLGSIANPAIAAAAETITVPTQTLDDFVAQQQIKKIDFIKLDIQGAEWFFLEGAQQTLKTHRPEIAMEISPTDLAQINKSSRDLLHLVASLGYQIHNIRNGRPTTVITPATVPKDFAATNVLCTPADR